MLFTDRPWLQDQSSVEQMPAGMLGRQEAAMLHALARDYFRGYGEIVDAGAFLGASSWCLAKGLSENPSVEPAAGRIHAYDLFTVWRESGDSYGNMAEALERDFGLQLWPGESTLPRYFANLGGLARQVQVHAGDITAQRWGGRPVELLFLDVCKTLDVWRHVLKSFYPSLIPGVSVVVHQDWHHALMPFLHVAQEHLSEAFEVVEPRADSSAAFRLVRRIPEQVLAEACAYEFTLAEELKLLDRATARFDRAGAYEMRLAKAVLLSGHRRFAEADAVLERLAAEVNPDDTLQRFNLGAAANTLARNEAHAANTPRNFDEAGYLASRPKVRDLVARGHFVSGYHHHLLYGGGEEAERRKRGRPPGSPPGG